MGMLSAGPSLQELVSFSPGAEQDESAPLSASDLRMLLDRIESRSEEIKDRVYRTVTKHYQEFLGIINGANGAVTDVESVARELESIFELLGESGSGAKGRDRKSGGDFRAGFSFDLEICELAAEVGRLRGEEEERDETIAVVQAIAELHERLLSTEREFHQGRLVEAAVALSQIRIALGLPADWTGERDDQQEGGDEGELRAFILLQDAWANYYSKLRSLLEDLFSQAFVLDERISELCVCSCVSCGSSNAGVAISEVQLTTILSAMDNMGVLDTRLATVADMVFKQVLDPILCNPQIDVASGGPLSSADTPGKTLLSWGLSQETQSEKPRHPDFYAKLLHVFKFLRANLLANNDLWMRRLGRVIWPRLAEAIIFNCLSKAVPNETSELAAFQELAKMTAEFEASLGKEGLIPDWDETKGDRLSKFSSEVEVHFALKKKKHVLAKARDMLVQSNYSLFVVSCPALRILVAGGHLHRERGFKGLGRITREKEERDKERARRANTEEKTKKDRDESDDVPFWQEEIYAITYPAKHLMEIVHQTLEDACLSTSRTAVELYHAARDALLLYRAVVPVKVAAQLNSIHQVAALCHNDCFYIAHHLLFLAFQYRAALPSNVQKIFSFVDLVPLFRRMGCEILEGQVHLIELDLMEGLDRANGFKSTDQKKQFQIASSAIQQAVTVLERVRMIWEPVLLGSVCNKLMGRLVETVVARLTTEVLALDDISVEESEQLRKLMLVALEGLSPLLGTGTGEVEVDGIDGSQTDDTIKKLVPSWQKLARLTDLLDMSLRPITQAWESGDLSLCGFSLPEVEKLVNAIFSETPLRTDCLKRIASISPTSHVAQL